MTRSHLRALNAVLDRLFHGKPQGRLDGNVILIDGLTITQAGPNRSYVVLVTSSRAVLDFDKDYGKIVRLVAARLLEPLMEDVLQRDKALAGDVAALKLP